MCRINLVGPGQGQAWVVTLPSPQRIASSRFDLPPLLGLVVVEGMEVIDQFLGVSQVPCWLPCVFRDIIALPVHQVLELSPWISWVFDRLDLPLVLSIPQLCRWRRVRDLWGITSFLVGSDFFERVQWPFDPFPSFVGGCWPLSVMPWYFLEGPKNVPLIC